MAKQSKAEQLAGNAAVAHAKYVRMGPRKVRRVVDVVRGMKTDEALSVLQFSPWRACTPVGKTIRSAVANAEQNKQLDPDTLWISEAYVDQGPSLRRVRARAQGRGYLVHKHTSHITVVVESRDEHGDPVEVAPPQDKKAARARRRAERAAEAVQQQEEEAAAVGTAESETAGETETEASESTDTTDTSEQAESAESAEPAASANDETDDETPDDTTPDDTTEEETR